jgi:hypothetical protein
LIQKYINSFEINDGVPFLSLLVRQEMVKEGEEGAARKGQKHRRFARFSRSADAQVIFSQYLLRWPSTMQTYVNGYR